MSRAPFQVSVYPYRRTEEGQFKFALMKRADEGFWQGVAGGGENNETALEAAKRETHEETGIPPTSDFLRLDTVESVPVVEFRDSRLWGDNTYVIPQFSFGVDAQNAQIMLSREHTEYKWFAYEEAHETVKFDGNKTALWELNKRLNGKGPRG